jgi:hypothetical protein
MTDALHQPPLCRDLTPSGYSDEAECGLPAGHEDAWHREVRWFDRDSAPQVEVVISWRETERSNAS